MVSCGFLHPPFFFFGYIIYIGIGCLGLTKGFALSMGNEFDVLGLSIFIEALIFMLILIIGAVYAWRKRALEWS
jgi:NADH:ubiquinone oxidoreductase subunit 3 (subunit A)